MTALVAITILAAAAPATPQVNVPPPPAAPPPVVVQAPGLRRTPDLSPVLFDVSITAGRDTLWSGSVRVGQTGANYSQSLRQADEVCPDRPRSSDDSYRSVENARQLNFNLMRRGGREESYSVSVRWQRPIAACEGGGNRGVSIDQQIDITPGQTLRLNGDAGLVVSLTRRP